MGMSTNRIEEIGKEMAKRVEVEYPDYSISFNVTVSQNGIWGGGIISYKPGGGEQQYEIENMYYLLVASEDSVYTALYEQISTYAGRMAGGRWFG